MDWASSGWIQLIGPAERVSQYRSIEISRPGGLQQLRWPTMNLADSPQEALSRLFAIPGSHYSDPEFSWKYALAPDIETAPNGNLFVVSLTDGAVYEIYRARGRTGPQRR